MDEFYMCIDNILYAHILYSGEAMFLVIWLFCASGIATAIALDMRWLVINRIGVSRSSWIAISIFGGPIAGVIYLLLRRNAYRALVAAALSLIGDSSVSVQTRRERLTALEHGGFIGRPIVRACLTALDRSSPPAGV